MSDQKSNCCCGTGNACPTHGGSDTPRRVQRYWNKLPDLFTSQNVVLASDYDALERELAAMTKERDEWKSIASQYAAEREHNAMKALEYQAERDTLRARVAELEKQNPQRIDISSLITLTTLKEPQ